MKFHCAAFLLLSGAASASMLRRSAHTSASNATESLRVESQKLDHVIQTVASKLEPGPTREFLKALRLCAPCTTFQRFGEPNDGGYVMCTDGLPQGLLAAYSYGISGYDGWGMAMAGTYHLPLHEYDCTNFKRPAVCAGCAVTFHEECINAVNGAPQARFKTLAQNLQESGNGMAPERSLLWKIDVEAAEWQVFAQEPVENLRKFRQIVVEYHWLNKQDQHPLYEQAVKKIEAAGFSATHLHGNNYGGGLQYFGEFSIPNVLEVTYIQTPPQGCAAGIPYHLPQDTPNNPATPEIPDAHLPTSM
jgi:hypothetical protein